MKTKYHDISVLKGQTIIRIDGMEKYNSKVIFTTSDGSKYQMFHEQDCCETVELVEVIGDPLDLLNTPILEASCEEGGRDEKDSLVCGGSHTWSFYNLRTIKGFVVLCWLGWGNGCCFEGVSFVQT